MEKVTRFHLTIGWANLTTEIKINAKVTLSKTLNNKILNYLHVIFEDLLLQL